MALLCLVATIVTALTSLHHVGAFPCPDVTASANCSFERAEPCTDAYTFNDEHGLRWRRSMGVTYTFHQDYELILSASPYSSYAYMGGTEDSRAWGLWTDLISPPVTVYGGCLQYIYHNSVCGDSPQSKRINLKVILRSEDDGDERSDRIVREYACVDDAKWYSDHISLSELDGTYRIVFSAQHHEWTNQAVAVDHVLYTHQSCSLRDDVGFDNGDCNWEYGDMCGYQQLEHIQETLRWENVMEDQLVARDRTLARIFVSWRHGRVLTVSGKANVAIVEDLVSTSFNYPDDLVSISVSSPKVHIKKRSCLVLNYYSGRHDTNNNNVTALVVKATQFENGTNFNILRELPSTLGNEWLPQFVPLPEGTYSLMFTARLLLPFGELLHDFIAIDDVEIVEKPCDYARCDPMQCAEGGKCSEHGQCIGQGLKHYTCACKPLYLGKYCQFNVNYTTNIGFDREQVPASRRSSEQFQDDPWGFGG